MNNLSDTKLIEAYLSAIKEELDSKFVDLLKQEIDARGLKVNVTKLKKKQLT